MSEKMTKRINLSQVVEDLNSGLTRWKKDDIGFGSLEKKYNLTNTEAIQLFSHPKIKNVESKIPTFVIVDDLPETNPALETPVLQETTETKVVVAPVVAEEPRRTVQQTTVIVREEQLEEEPVLVPFI